MAKSSFLKNYWKKVSKLFEIDFDKWLEPDDEAPMMYDEFDDEIYEDEEYVEINDWILSMDSVEDLAVFVEADTECECVACGNSSVDDFSGRFLLINGDWYCEDCVKENIRTAGED